MKVGQLIKRERIKKGYNQIEFAKKIGVSQSVMSLYECNTKDLTRKMLDKVCDALEIPLPIFWMLAAEPEDIKPEKRHLFAPIKSAVESLLEEYQNDENSKSDS